MQLFDDEIRKILSEINSDSERNRRAEELINADIFEGKLNEFVASKIRELFPSTGEHYSVADYNLHRKISEKKSKSYIRPPIRGLDKKEESSAYTKILEDFGFNDTMKMVDLFKNRHRYCGVGVIRERKSISDGTVRDKYNFWALAPYDFCVHRDVNGEIYAWSIPVGKDKEGDIWTIWSDRTHIKIRTKDYKGFEIIPIEGNPLNVNPYGILPFIYVPMDTSGVYPLTSSLPRQTIELNTSISIYMTSGNMQIGQMVITHPKKQKIESISHGLMTAINLPQENGDNQSPTEVKYISPNPNLEGQKESILTYMTMILDEHGINSSSAIKSGEKFTSGFDRLLSNADVQDIIENNQDLYIKVENDVYKCIRAMTLRDNSYTFKSEKLSVKFSRPKILSSDSEKLDNLKKKKELGLWDEWQLLQDADPNLSEEEAKKIIEERASLKALDARNVFNGARVTSLVEVVVAVASGSVPVESGVQILISSFGMDDIQARKIINDSVVKTTTIAAPELDPEVSFEN